MADVVSNVLVYFKGNTADLKRKMKELDGEQKKLVKSQIDAVEKQNASLESSIARWGKVAGAIGAVTGAVVVLSKGYETLAKNSRLRAASMGADMSGLRSSVQGLVDDTRLMEFASKAMNGTFKLSQGQMEQALQGALALRKTMGVELPRALDRVQQAITEGNIEPLKELGLVMKDVEGDSVEGLNAALQALAGETRKVGGDFEVAGDDVARSMTKMANSQDQLMESLGRIATALSPVLEIIAGAAERVAGLAAALSDLGDRNNRITVKEFLKSKIGIPHLGNLGDIIGPDAKTLDMGPSFAGSTARTKIFASEAPLAQGFNIGLDDVPIDLSGSVADETQRSSNRFDPNGFSLAGSVADPARRGGQFFSAGEGSLNEQKEKLAVLKEQVKIAEEQGKIIAENARLTKNRSMVSQLFGTPAEIEAHARAMEMLSGTFDVFANATGAAMGAWIDGSASAGEAFKKAIGEGLKAMAIDMSIKAVREGAAAIASLAYYDYAGAAAHGKAAAAYAGGAVAAAAGAKLLGVGSSPAAGAGPASAGFSRARSEPANNNRVFFIGDQFGGLSPRERAARFRDQARDADFRIEGDVVVNG